MAVFVSDDRNDGAIPVLVIDRREELSARTQISPGRAFTTSMALAAVALRNIAICGHIGAQVGDSAAFMRPASCMASAGGALIGFGIVGSCAGAQRADYFRSRAEGLAGKRTADQAKAVHRIRTCGAAAQSIHASAFTPSPLPTSRSSGNLRYDRISR